MLIWSFFTDHSFHGAPDSDFLSLIAKLFHVDNSRKQGFGVLLSSGIAIALLLNSLSVPGAARLKHLTSFEPCSKKEELVRFWSNFVSFPMSFLF